MRSFLHPSCVVPALALLSLLMGCVPDGTTETPTGGRHVEAFAPGQSSEEPLERPVATPRPLAVLSRTPVGDDVQGRSVRIIFNQPVVAFGDLDTMEAPGLLTLDPPVEGRAWWQTPSELVFEAKDAFPRARHFEVKLATPLEAASGERLEGPYTFSFQTRGLSVARLTPGDRERDVAPDRPIQVIFDDAVNIKDVQRHLDVTQHPLVDGKPGEEGKKVDVEVRYAKGKELEEFLHWGPDMTDRIVMIIPRRPLPRSHEIRVRLTAGLAGRAGPIGLLTDVTSTFATWEPLRVVRASCGPEEGCEAYRTDITLSNPIEEAQLKRIIVSPHVDELDVQVWGYGGEGTEIAFSGRFVPEKNYTIRLPADLTDIHGQKLGAAYTHTVRFAFAPEMLELEAPIGVVRSASKQHVGLIARHVQKASVRTRIVSEAQLAELARAGHDLFSADTWRDLDLASPAFDQETELPLKPDHETHWLSMAIDLEKLTGDRTGVVVLDVSATEAVAGWSGELPGPTRGVYHVTDLAPIFMASPSVDLLRVVRLSNGAPVKQAEVELWSLGHAVRPLGKTDANGFLNLEHDATWATRFAALRVRSGEDGHLVAVDDASRRMRTWPLLGEDEPSSRLRPRERLIGKVVTERDLYMPAERVSLVGFIAIDSPYAETGLRRLPEDTDVTIELEDDEGQVVATETVKTLARGKFTAQLQLPEEGRLGTYRINAQLAGFSGELHANVKVKEFRVPEFKVDAVLRRSELRADESTFADVAASFYFGGPTPIQSFSTSMWCYSYRFDAKGLDGWTMGLPPAWRSYGLRPNITGKITDRAAADQGRLTLPIHPESHDTHLTRRCTSSVAVKDASEQWSGAEMSFNVHPANAYIAVRTPRKDAVEGSTVSLDVRGVNWQGLQVPMDEVRITFERTTWEPVWVKRGARRYIDTWESKKVPAGSCKVAPTAPGKDGVCVLSRVKPGVYELVATTTVDGRSTSTSGTFWVSERAWAPRFAGEAELRLMLDREEVTPGESVRVAIWAPWKNAHGTLLVHRRGLREHHPFVLDGESAIVTLPVSEQWLPGATFEAVIFVPDAVETPRIETTTQSVIVTTDHRRLDVSVSAQREGRPGDEVPIKVRVRDVAGRPVAGRVAVWAVDEAVLDLTDYRVPDLLATLVPGTGEELSMADELSRILEPYKPRAYDEGFGLMGFGAGGAGYGAGGASLGARGAGGKPSPRANFQITPLFIGDAETNSAGEATVTLVLPDNLSTFRITAVASASLPNSAEPGRYGDGETSIQSRTEIVVRAAVPRALRPGDRATIAAIINNGFGPAGTLEVEGQVNEAQGALAFVGSPSAKRAIGAGEQLRFPFEVVASAVGTPKVELRVRLVPDGGAPAIEDAIEVVLPIVPEPTMIDRVALYGSVGDDEPLSVPLVLPSNVRADYGGLSLTATSSLLGGLEDAAQSLITYPYGCAEQTSSRLLPMVALSALTDHYDLAGRSPRDFVNYGVQRLLMMQTSDGGFAYWPDSELSNPQVSAYVLWVLHLAQKAGYSVPERAMSRAEEYLAGVTRTPDRDWSDSVLYYHDIRRAIAVHALAERGRDIPEALDQLYERRRELPLFARAFVLSAMHHANPADPRLETVLQDILNDVEQTAATASTRDTVRWGLWEFFHSDTRSSAILLMALLRVAPQHPVVLKLASGLMAGRRDGTWRNTQENAYALVALSDYARVYEADVPDFKARVWVEDRPVIETAFAGRDFEAKSGHFGMADLVQVARQREADAKQPLDVTVQRTGKGRLYYRLGFEYAWLQADEAPARERGLAITRTLRTRDGEVTGGSVQAGETVALDIEIRAMSRTHYVAVDVPIPAGLEAIHRDLGKGQSAMVIEGTRGSWVSHEELRKDRVQVFADDLSSGSWRHTIFLKATTPGSYVMPPAVAEAMYEPEVYGRSKGARLDVR